MFFPYRIGATLRTLDGYKLVDKKSLQRFLLTCQSEVVLFFLLSAFSSESI